MAKEEILAGLKIAIERGYSLEKAKQSFINAGYDSREVEEAASSLGGIISSYEAGQLEEVQEKINFLPVQREIGRKKGKGIIILVIVLIILLAALGASFFFQEKIVNFATNLFAKIF